MNARLTTTDIVAGHPLGEPGGVLWHVEQHPWPLPHSRDSYFPDISGITQCPRVQNRLLCRTAHPVHLHKSPGPRASAGDMAVLSLRPLPL